MNHLKHARKAVKRHAELLLIIAFITADCFLSGWVVDALAISALIYMVAPAIPMFLQLTPAGRITYVKALVRTPKAQRVGFILFWVYSTRWLLKSLMDANLISGFKGPPSFENVVFQGLREFGPIAFLGTPFLVYGVAALLAVALRAPLKATKDDPDLIQQRQLWCGAAQAIFMAAFIGSILSITLNPHGPGYMISNWLLASACDANLFAPDGVGEGVYNFGTKFIFDFDRFILTAISGFAFIVLLKPALRLNALLTSFAWRVVSPTSLQNLVEAFLEALHLPQRALGYNEAHPLIANSFRTVAWLVACFFSLFWLFGFCGGPIGVGIQNWMMASALDAGLGPAAPITPEWIFQPELRIFLGSVVALYGTVPLAVTAANLLPFASARRINLNADGILFAQGPYLAMLFRQFRLWTDFASITSRALPPRKDQKFRAEFQIRFRSGGSIKFTNEQVSPQDLGVLLDAVNEHAVACVVAQEVFETHKKLLDASTSSATSDGGTHGGIAKSAAQDFKSTIFVPFTTGHYIPESKIRITKQLGSKPLCAVYLARDEEGRMVIVKQFYLAEETDETRALRKTLDREYELLSRLDHPGLAKVLNCFTHDKSTYLVIEHRIGSDLRVTVRDHGPRSESLTVAWAKQLCEIMIYLHNQDPPVIHRDLTPDNVIAGEDGRLRLIDFGAAREFLDGITGTMLGKHCYVAPEQLRGEATQRSDIYSFGCTLHFLLTGRDPLALTPSSPAQTMECSEELDQLIRECTKFNENERPQSFTDVLERLNEMNKGVWLKLPSKQKEKVTA